MTTRWAGDLVERADEIDPHTRDKAQFYLRQIAGALSPSNFVATNPELMRTTLAESGENLVRGMHMMAEDIAAGAAICGSARPTRANSCSAGTWPPPPARSCSATR